MPLQLLTADEKIDELQSLIITRIMKMLNSKYSCRIRIRPRTLKERVEQIVQREVDERIRAWQGAEEATRAAVEQVPRST